MFEICDLSACAAHNVMMVFGARGKKLIVCMTMCHIDATDQSCDLECADRAIKRCEMRGVRMDALREISQRKGSACADQRRDGRQALRRRAKTTLSQDSARIEYLWS